MRVRLTMAVAGVGTVLIAAVSGAQVAFTNPNPETRKSADERSSKWSEADANGDGKVTEAEASLLIETEARNAFAKYDKNRSGEVERREFPQKPEWLKAFERLDTDGSGGLTFEEGRRYFEQRARKRFQTIDRNDDGLLTADELAPVKPVSIIESMMERDTDGDGALTSAELASAGDVAYFEDLHIRADMDGSGTVSRTELADEYRRRAMAKDADSDGGVTLEEYSSGQQVASMVVAELTFSELDRNGDDRITVDDLLAPPPKKVNSKNEVSSSTPETP